MTTIGNDPQNSTGEPIEPNSWMNGLITAVPGSRRVTVDSGNEGKSFREEKAALLAQAMDQAVEVSRCTPLEYSMWRTVHSIDGEIASIEQRRDGLSLGLAIGGYLTDIHTHTTCAASTLMEMLDVWSLADVVGQRVEVLYTNNAGSGDPEFRISNGSIVRALRRLDVRPDLIVH